MSDNYRQQIRQFFRLLRVTNRKATRQARKVDDLKLDSVTSYYLKVASILEDLLENVEQLKKIDAQWKKMMMEAPNERQVHKRFIRSCNYMQAIEHAKVNIGQMKVSIDACHQLAQRELPQFPDDN